MNDWDSLQEKRPSMTNSFVGDTGEKIRAESWRGHTPNEHNSYHPVSRLFKALRKFKEVAVIIWQK